MPAIHPSANQLEIASCASAAGSGLSAKNAQTPPDRLAFHRRPQRLGLLGRQGAVEHLEAAPPDRHGRAFPGRKDVLAGLEASPQRVGIVSEADDAQ
jgi:hypothetical protein